MSIEVQKYVLLRVFDRVGDADFMVCSPILPSSYFSLENASEAFSSVISRCLPHNHAFSLQNTMWMLEKLQHHAAARPPLGREGPPAVVPFEVFQKMFEEYSSTPHTDKSKGRKDVDSDGWSGFDSIMQLLPETGCGDDSSIDGSDPESAMNAVQYLAKEDKLFDSFLKMNLKDKPTGRVSLLYCLLS
jgi:hypothetical protein